MTKRKHERTTTVVSGVRQWIADPDAVAMLLKVFDYPALSPKIAISAGTVHYNMLHDKKD